MTGTRVESGHAPVLEKPRSFLDILRKKLGFKRGKKMRQASSAISSDSFTRQTFLECTHSDSHSVDSVARCKICLNNYGSTHSICTKRFELNSCKCKFCTNCLHEYVKYSIQNCNVLPIQCPDSKCKYSGYLTDDEIQLILNTGDNTDINNNTYSSLEDIDPQGEKACFIEPNKNVDLYERYLSLCEEFRILRDPSKVYCPQPLCQNICTKGNEKKIVCDKCSHEFCVQCSKACKANGVTVDSCTCATSSESNFNFENIKRCPNCSILIERADGCAQIMCKICKHTFCFYCLTSLENDYLLKHYTRSGPCKGKLGHSKISLFFHRVSVVAVFSGTIALLVVLSPFLLFALPCIVLNRNFRKNCVDKISTKIGQSNQ